MKNINLNTFPYFDDFAPEKGFHKILFKPGYAVQARELTQLQTILQEQVRRFGSHVFKDGSVVVGCAETTNFNVPYIKVLDMNDSDVPVTDAALLAFDGVTLTGQTNNVKAVVKKVQAGSETQEPNLKTIYVQYVSTGDDNIGTFVAGEVLTASDGSTLVVAGSPTSPIGEGSLFTLGEGILFANGHFVYHPEQTIVIDRYSTTPTKRVGVSVLESITDNNDDETLLDPAQGSYNYTAPGADRFTLTTNLSAYGTGETTPDNFYLFFDIQSGKINRKYTSTQYAEINKVLARRTFDESGDYTSKAFPIVVREHLLAGNNGGRYTTLQGGSAAKLVVAVEPGKAYVKGFEHELLSTQYLETDKAIDTGLKENVPTTTSYGNYVEVTSLQGVFPINEFANVELRTSAPATIGTAKVRAIEVNGSTYRMYLYDIVMSSGDISSVTTIRYTPNSASATVVSTFALQNSKFTAAVFNLPKKHIKDVSDISYVYRKVVSATSTAGVVTATITTPESWAFTVGGANDVIVVSAGGTVQTYAGATVASNVLTITGVGGTLTGPVTLMALVRRNASHNAKTVIRSRYVTIHTGTHPQTSVGPYSLGFYDVLSVEGVWQADATTAFPAVDPWVPETDTNWTEVTTNFVLDNGQRDGFYGIASIRPIASVTNKKLIVKLTYFEHGTSSGFYTIKSYPLPTENVVPSSSQINWHEIPSYTSVGGEVFDLRNAIDFRPTVALTANNSATIAGASLNPATGSAYIPGFTHPEPSEEFIADLEYYLSRTDAVVINSEGSFYVLRGTPSESTPISPRQPNDCMTLGYVSVAPYPSLSPSFARTVSKPQYACRVSLVENRRFTMRDISSIEKRVDNLEYFTNLSLLEQTTSKMLILNSLGEDRFKNGILVDSFVGHNIGNVYDPTYACSISDGILRPKFGFDAVTFAPATISNAVRKADDAAIVVRQQLTNSKFSVGDLVTNGAGAEGLVRHAVLIAENTNEDYRWLRLYLKDASGTFTAGNVVTSGSKTGTITYGAEIDDVLDAALQPDLVSYAKNGNLLTVPYTHTVYAENPHASKSRKVSSKLLFNYVGSLRLTPSSDMMFDIQAQPEVQKNDAGKKDNWEALDNAWGTEWKVWEKSWHGLLASPDSSSIQPPSDVTETTSQRIAREGTGLKVRSGLSDTIGQRAISTEILPFIRPRVVEFSAVGMKPNTVLNTYFDGINVSDFCKPSADAAYGDPIVVDDNGHVGGMFKIPENMFSVGAKTFVLTDSTADPFDPSAKTVALATYSASGVLVNEINDILSTSSPESTLGRQLQTQDNVIARLTRASDSHKNVADPIAQTFVVADNPNGIMISKMDVYFKSRSTTLPITLQIRETVGGLPSEVILPYSSVTLDAKDVNVSTVGDSATEFTFDAPVFLKNDTEYCFVLIPAGNTEEYEIWTSETGELEVGGIRRTDSHPYTGNLLIAGNAQSWTTVASEHIKFSLFRCAFDADASASVTFINSPEDYVVLDEAVDVGDTIIGSTGTGVVTEFNPTTSVAKIAITSGTLSVGAVSVVEHLAGTVTAGTGTPVVTGVGTKFSTQLAANDILVSATGALVGTVETITNTTSLALFSNAAIAVTAQPVFIRKNQVNIVSFVEVDIDAIAPFIGFLSFNNTSIDWDYKLTTSAGVTAALSTPLQINATEELQARMKLWSTSSQPATVVLGTTFSTDSENISPVIDITKVGMMVIYNLVNNDSTAETGDTGAALSKYVTKRVVLDDGQEAEDLRVYVNANIPVGAGVEVYAKLLNNKTDTTQFKDRPWVKLDQTSPVNTVGFNDYTYQLPSSTLSGGVYQYTNTTTHIGFKSFAVKIVMKSAATTEVPQIKNMRAIALQA